MVQMIMETLCPNPNPVNNYSMRCSSQNTDLDLGWYWGVGGIIL